MKKFFLTAYLLATVLILAGVAGAAPIVVASTGGDAANQYNNSPLTIPAPYASPTTIAITPHPLWASALAGTSWVSFYQTGMPLDYVVPNGQVLTFTHQFMMPSWANSATGSIVVMADDSASVSLNGNLLTAEATQAGNGYELCSDFAIGCKVSTAKELGLTAEMFNYGGLNKLEFGVAQRGLVSYGLNYRAEISAVPEPDTYALLGAGLVGLALLRRRKAE